MPMQSFVTGGKNVEVFPAGVPGAPEICLNTFEKEGTQVFDLLHQKGCPPFTLVAVSNLQWNCDMAPWDCPAAFRSGNPFSGGADRYLQLLTGEILPRVEALTGTPSWRGIAGYSLAGLFAVYAIYRTDMFSRVASMSGSLWFPGIREYLFTHVPLRRPDRMYFSLGDKEHKTRNPLLCSVRQNTLDIQEFYQGQGISTVFCSQPGNHFCETTQRTAAGIYWLLTN